MAEGNSKKDEGSGRDGGPEGETEDLGVFIRRHLLLAAVAVLGLLVFIRSPTPGVAVGVVIVVMATSRKVTSDPTKEKLSPEGRAVVITGCDTGLGHDLAKTLAAMGVVVFAGCLDGSGKGARALKAMTSPNLHVLQMDVTDDKQVKDGVTAVKKFIGKTELWGLVNNAAINTLCDAELTTMAQYERLVAVNQLGLVRVTKAFLPLIRKATGRVVNILDVRGRLALPFAAAYTMTQFAGEAFTDILRMELARFGPKICTVEPGNFTATTNFLDLRRLSKDLKQVWSQMDSEQRQTYSQEYVDAHIEGAGVMTAASSQALYLVVEAVEHALFAREPKIRYTVGGTASWYDYEKWRCQISGLCPSWLLDGMNLHDVRMFPLPERLQREGTPLADH